MPSEQVRFQLKAGDPALDFVNTLDNRFAPGGPKELIKTYHDLLQFASQSGLVPKSQRDYLAVSVRDAEQDAVVKVAGQLREGLAEVLYAILNNRSVDQKTLIRLDTIFRKALIDRKLEFDVPSGLPPARWQGFQHEAYLPLWTIALAAEQLLTAGPIDRLRACEADTCRWLFLDKTKNHSRRWCDMKVCGNRMKMARFKGRAGA